MAKVEIKKQSSNEANVSQRHISYDIYVDGKYHTTTNDIIKAMDLKEAIEKGITNTGDTMQIKNAFTRGQMRALNAIQEKMDRVGIKAENIRSPEQQNKIAAITKEIQDLEKQIEGQTEMSKRIQLISRRNNLETVRRRIKAENLAEKTLFQEKGYKAVQYVGDTSGSVSVVTPGGQRSAHDNLEMAKKYIAKSISENRTQNAVRSGLVQKGKTLIYRGREMDVVSVSGDRITLDDEGNRYTVNANDRQLEPGTTGE